MSRENLLYMRGIMEKAVNFNIQVFQGGETGLVDSIEELHKCGNKACFAGYMALSPKFQKEGGSIKWNGAPEIGAYEGAITSVKQWLGISEELTEDIVFGWNQTGLWDKLGIPWKEARPEHMIKIIDWILAGELG